jgi:ABC-type polysaccharide/polyol phosphate transport system ATPase subunit
MAIIEVNHLTKEFRLGQLHSLRQTLSNAASRLRGRPVEQRQPFKALDDIDFRVEEGEVLGIIGHNGAGKSTLLKILAGISRPTHGSVKVRGRVAPLIEVGAGLVPDLTGRENIYLNATILGMKRAEIKRKFDEIVAFAELDDFLDTPVKRYSSGMMVRLGFSIATSVNAQILIVDEVLAVGDLAFQRKCLDRMEVTIKRSGKTVLIVSHNLRQVERLCPRVVLLDHGRTILDGPGAESCNAFYEQSDRKIQRNRNQTLAARGRLVASGEIELTRARMLDQSGRQVESVTSGQDVTFVLSYKVNCPIRNPVFGVGVHTTDFIYLATVQSVGQLDCTTLDPGMHEVTCRVSRLPLLPGVYSLRVGVAVGELLNATYYAEGVLHFSVHAPGINRAWVSHEAEGFIALDTAWNIESDATQTASRDSAPAHEEPAARPGARRALL